MAWIKAEYAEEVAVVTTWLATFLPWSVSYTGDAPAESRLFFLRFPVFDLQVRFPTEVTVDGTVVDAGVPEMLAAEYGGVGLLGNVHVVLPPTRLGSVAGAAGTAYLLWTAAMVLTLALFVLSLAMYRREETVQAMVPLGYVRLTSIAFGLLTVLLAAATAMFSQSDGAYGSPVPVGVVLIGLFAIVLWRAGRNPEPA